MKKVRDTKYPTIRQIESMSENLRDKFKEYSNIQISTHSFSQGRLKTEYLLYVAEIYCNSLNSWQELLSFYHKVMKEG